MYLKQ